MTVRDEIKCYEILFFIPQLVYTGFTPCIGLEEAGYGVLDTQNAQKVRNQNLYLFQSPRLWLYLTYEYPNTSKGVLSILCTLFQVF